MEQKHGDLRISRLAGLGHDFTDEQQCYKANTDYPYREMQVQQRRKELASAAAVAERQRQRRQPQHHARVVPGETKEMQ